MLKIRKGLAKIQVIISALQSPTMSKKKKYLEFHLHLQLTAKGLFRKVGPMYAMKGNFSTAMLRGTISYFVVVLVDLGSNLNFSEISEI